MRLLAPLLIGMMLAAGTFAYADAYAGQKYSKYDEHSIKMVGEPKSCLRHSDIRTTDVIDDRTIDFTLRNRDIYRNVLPNKCSGLNVHRTITYRTTTGRLCSVDIIRVLDNVGGRPITLNACGLGEFQKIEIIKKPSSKG